MHAFIRKYVAADDASDEVIEYLTSMASDLDTSAEDFHEALFGFFPALESKAGIANSIAEVIQRVRAGEETGHKEVAPLVSGSMVEPLVASSLSSPPTESVLWKCPRCTFDNPVDSSKEFIACGMCGFDEKQSDAVPLASLAASHQEATQNRSRDDQAVEIQGSHEDSSSDNSTSATQAGGPEPTRDGSAGNEPGEPVKSGGKGQKGKGAKGKNAKGASGQPRPKEEGSSRETQNSSEAGDGTLKSTNESKRSKGKGAKGKGAKGKGAKGAPEQRPLEEDEPTHELPTSSEPEVDELLVSTELEVADTSEPSALQHNSEEEFPSIQSHIAQRGKGVGRSVEWTCAVCTFTHTELLEACEMCCTPRPPEQQLGDHAARSAVPAKAFKQASQKTRRKPAAKDASSIELSPEDDAALILQRVSDVLSSLKTVRTMLEKEQLLELDTLALMTAVDFKEIGLCASDSNALVDAVQQELKVRDLQLPEEASEMVHVSNTGSTKGNSEDGDEANARMRNDISTLMELLPSDAGLDQQQVECTSCQPHDVHVCFYIFLLGFNRNLIYSFDN